MQLSEYEKMHAVETRHWWFRARLAVVTSVLDRYVPVGGRGLDCSCGTGMTLSALPKRVQFGADLSGEALKFARKRGLAKLVQADLTRLPLQGACLDLLTCLDTLEHIERDDLALAEVFRVLRPGGYALFTVPQHPALFSAHDRALHHVRRYRYEELRSRVLNAGFEIVRLTPINCALLPVVALARVLSRGKEKESDTDKLPLPPVNVALFAAFAIEKLLLGLSDLPFGVSLLCLAQKSVKHGQRA
ncbi:MAG: class I SAM-dependent methyltransferase [Planctomycetes bacterium]|nr:class I SAM-dependent methyltransferase [Planctomycetota bacterium]